VPIQVTTTREALGDAKSWHELSAAPAPLFCRSWSWRHVDRRVSSFILFLVFLKSLADTLSDEATAETRRAHTKCGPSDHAACGFERRASNGPG
jgi:hypothetical protein